MFINKHLQQWHLEKHTRIVDRHHRLPRSKKMDSDDASHGGT